MNLKRVRRDIENARQHFDYVEAHPTENGGLTARVALQTSRRLYTLEVIFLETYPHTMPRVFVRRPDLEYSPHQFRHKNQICYLHSSFWNPGCHDLCFVIARAAKWLAKYEVYLAKGRWPGAGIDH